MKITIAYFMFILSLLVCFAKLPTAVTTTFCWLIANAGCLNIGICIGEYVRGSDPQ